jgi:hypothetical protein
MPVIEHRVDDFAQISDYDLQSESSHGNLPRTFNGNAVAQEVAFAPRYDSRHVQTRLSTETRGPNVVYTNEDYVFGYQVVFNAEYPRADLRAVLQMPIVLMQLNWPTNDVERDRVHAIFNVILMSMTPEHKAAENGYVALLIFRSLFAAWTTNQKIDFLQRKANQSEDPEHMRHFYKCETCVKHNAEPPATVIIVKEKGKTSCNIKHYAHCHSPPATIAQIVTLQEVQPTTSAATAEQAVAAPVAVQYVPFSWGAKLDELQRGFKWPRTDSECDQLNAKFSEICNDYSQSRNAEETDYQSELFEMIKSLIRKWAEVIKVRMNVDKVRRRTTEIQCGLYCADCENRKVAAHITFKYIYKTNKIVFKPMNREHSEHNGVKRLGSDTGAGPTRAPKRPRIIPLGI